MIPEAIRTTTADRIGCMDIIISRDMKDYSGWAWQEHVRWVCELSGLDGVNLILLVGSGYMIVTDESVNQVWLLSNDYYKTTARLLYGENDDNDDYST